MKNREALKYEYLSLYSEYLAGHLIDIKRMWELEFLLGV